MREFAHEAAADGALVLYGACDAVVRTPYGPFAEALDRLVRDGRSGRAPRRPRRRRRRAQAAAARPRRPRRRPPRPRHGRPGHRAPPAPHRGGRAADRDSRSHGPLAARRSRTGTGPTPRRCCSCATSRGPPPTRACCSSRRSATPRPTCRRSSATRSSTCAAPRGSCRIRLAGLSSATRSRSSSRQAAGGGLPGPAGAGRVDPRAHRRERVPADGAVARARRDGRRGRRRPTLAGSLAGARHARRRARGGQPAARAARAATTRAVLELAAVAGPEFETDVLREAGHLDAPALAAALDEAVAQRHDRGGSGPHARPPLRPRARAPGALRPAYRGAARRASSADRRGPRRARLRRLGPRARRCRPPLRRRSADRRDRPRRGVQPARGRRGDGGAGVRRGGGGAADGARARDPGRNRTAPTRSSISARRPTAAGRSVESQDAFLAAAEIARGLGDGRRLSRAAVGYEDACWRMGIDDGGALELLEEAGEALEAGDSQLRVRVLGALGRALAFAARPEESALVRDEAIAMARRVGDRRGLALMLSRSYWLRGPTPFRDILDMLAEARDIAQQLGDIEIGAEAIQWRIASLLAIGDLTPPGWSWPRCSTWPDACASRSRCTWPSTTRAAIALCDGRLREAEAAAERSREWSRLLAGRDPSSVYGIQMFGIRREQGRLAELAPAVRSLAASDRAAAWRPGLAALWRSSGWSRRRAPSSTGSAPTASTRCARRSGWRRSRTSPTPASIVGDAAMARLVYAELAAALREQRDDRPRRGVLRRGRPLPRDARGGLRRPRRGGPPLRGGAGARPRGGRAHVGRPHRVRVRAAASRRRCSGGRRPRGGAPGRGGRAGGRGSACGRCSSGCTRRRRTGSTAPSGLSPREVEILRLVARGLSNRDVGRALSISEHTAANHIRSILRKTGAANRTEAAAYAYANGLVAG